MYTPYIYIYTQSLHTDTHSMHIHSIYLYFKEIQILLEKTLH